MNASTPMTEIATLELAVASARKAASEKKAAYIASNPIVTCVEIVTVPAKMTLAEKNAALVASVKSAAFRPIYGPLAPMTVTDRRAVYGPKAPVRPIYGPAAPSAGIMLVCRMDAQLDAIARANATKLRISALTAELARIAA